MTYEDGKTYRVTSGRASLEFSVVTESGPGWSAHQMRSVQLEVGEIVTCVGERYSGGSDGINRPVFTSAKCQVAAEFRPNSWGWPVTGSLEPVTP